MLKNYIPAPFHPYFAESLLSFPIQETKATCFNCNHTFNPSLKCCTYHPFLPNFLVGVILQDPSTAPESIKAIESKITNKEYALPLGLIAPTSLQIPFNRRIPGEFGHRADWACPFLLADSNQCGIWKNRNSQCTSFYCKSDYGSNGFQFWDNIKKHMHSVEIEIAKKILKDFNWCESSVELQKDFLNRREGSLFETQFNYLRDVDWNRHWKDTDLSPHDFYLECSRLFLEKSSTWSASYQESSAKIPTPKPV
ncbi:MAG: hypothetical protein AB7O96_14905 [Pseudobdellovibrionaceae bacterium]